MGVDFSYDPTCGNFYCGWPLISCRRWRMMICRKSATNAMYMALQRHPCQAVTDLKILNSVQVAGDFLLLMTAEIYLWSFVAHRASRPSLVLYYFHYELSRILCSVFQERCHSFLRRYQSVCACRTDGKANYLTCLLRLHVSVFAAR